MIEKASATAGETSLSRRVLIPMLAIGLLAGGVGAAWTYRAAADELERQARDRAALLASAINHAAMVATEIDAIQHVVEEVAADGPHVADILVVGQGQVLASSDPALRGAALAALDDPAVRQPIEHASVTGDFGFVVPGRHTVLVAPLEPHVDDMAMAAGDGAAHAGHGGPAHAAHGDTGSGRPEHRHGELDDSASWLDAPARRGVIYMGLSPESATAGLNHILGGFLPALLGSVAAVLVGAAWLLRRRVLAPLRSIRTTIRRQASGDWAARATVGTPDEIGDAAATMNTMLDAAHGREAELRLALAKADASSQAKSEFLAHMSHELRTPLNAVIGFADMLSSEALGPLGVRRYAEYAEDIGDSGRHLLGVIEHMLTLAKAEAGALALDEGDTVSLSDTVEASVRMLRLRAESKRIALDIDADGAPPVRGDALMMRQVVINLMGNAVKFTDDGGRVAVTAGRAATGAAWLTVADTGRGMSAKEVRDAFTPFERGPSHVARNYEGTGLGLPLSKHMVEAHGGTLSIESAPGVGTTVRVELPAERVVDDTETPTTPTAPSVPQTPPVTADSM